MFTNKMTFDTAMATHQNLHLVKALNIVRED